MSAGDVQPEPTPVEGAKHVRQIGAADPHMTAARRQADILVARAQTLARNGVDLRNPERMAEFVCDKVSEAVRGSAVQGCGCHGDHGTAALILLGEMARQLAEATR